MRIFAVYFNLDAASADMDSIFTDADRLAWFNGFRAAARGGEIPKEWSGAMLLGASFGAAAHQDALARHLKQSERGKASAAARVAKHGTSNPRANRKQDVNHGSATVLTGCEPRLNHIEYPVSSIEEPVTKNDNPISSNQEKTGRFAPPTEDQVREYCDERNNRVDPSAFIAYYESIGWVIGKHKMKSWKGAVQTWEKKDGFKPTQQPASEAASQKIQYELAYQESQQGKAAAALKERLQAIVDARKAQEQAGA
jgi:hypothetical protein